MGTSNSTERRPRRTTNGAAESPLLRSHRAGVANDRLLREDNTVPLSAWRLDSIHDADPEGGSSELSLPRASDETVPALSARSSDFATVRQPNVAQQLNGNFDYHEDRYRSEVTIHDVEHEFSDLAGSPFPSSNFLSTGFVDTFDEASQQLSEDDNHAGSRHESEEELHTPPPVAARLISPSWIPPVLMQQSSSYMSTPETPKGSIFVLGSRRSSILSTRSDITVDDETHDGHEDENMQQQDFYPPLCRHFEWMGRSIESLVLGHQSVAPILAVLDEDHEGRSPHLPALRRGTMGSEYSYYSRRGSLASLPGNHRGSLSFGGAAAVPPMHGGTLANYYNRRRGNQANDSERVHSTGRRGSLSFAPAYRRRSSSGVSCISEDSSRGQGGPNLVFSLLAREVTGQNSSIRGTNEAARLRAMGGHALYTALDKPAGGMSTEVAFLTEAIDNGDWVELQSVISRLAPRIIGDGSAHLGVRDRARAIEDPTLPRNTSPYYAGGGRLGLERDAFVLAGGVEVLLRIFREPRFVGHEVAYSNDARDLGPELVSSKLAPCWNEVLVSLRELVYAIPTLVEDGAILEGGKFLPFLFTIMSHDLCFDSAAALIEEILSLQSHSPQQPAPSAVDGDDLTGMASEYQRISYLPPPSTFFLGNVPNLYSLWGSFNCRQLAHFCRVLALLIFEPEDRQLLESPAVLKSLELLQLRRNRASRAGKDATVDMNQAIVLGDKELVHKLLKLLRVMNFAPTLRRTSPYHVMAHFPFIAETLVMLGLSELDNWNEIDRLERLSRTLIPSEESDEALPLLGELGAVADMLEGLASSLLGGREQPNQLGHIIHVINAALQAGVVVGRPRRRRVHHLVDRNRDQAAADTEPDEGSSIQDLASAAGILTDQLIVRRLYSNTPSDYENLDDEAAERQPSRDTHTLGRGRRISTPEDAANELQFNALLLGPYQVEVLFVLCTLLGGRRKIDAQEIFKECGLIPTLDDMFYRLAWGTRRRDQSSNANVNVEAINEEYDQTNAQQDDAVPSGIHGPGCECTPESALCVQYLRLLHNFCDRDCDNYDGRRLLLSDSEVGFVFAESGTHKLERDQLKPGLLTKIIQAFIKESDDSPYRFWLASCVEAYLRGSSPAEQYFSASTGLLLHLVEDITSDRLHCAGSLQTSFDLLGELCKGNVEVLRLLVKRLDEVNFRKLMSIAAANLVDSNVFIRSLLLSTERISAVNGMMPLHADCSGVAFGNWASATGSHARSYLTHSWWDATPVRLLPNDEDVGFPSDYDEDKEEYHSSVDDSRPSDWFPTMQVVDAVGLHPPISSIPNITSHDLNYSVGHFGWVFSPMGDALSLATYSPSTIERLSWFLAANQARLLRDLLFVVDLRNINHENICCLNTAVVIAIFAHRRQELGRLLDELRQLNEEDQQTQKRRAEEVANQQYNSDDIVDRAFLQAMRYLDLERETSPPYARRASLSNSTNYLSPFASTRIDRVDIMRNFREVLWFWIEYYSHRGRDRLSLEFSSHLRFQEWKQVVGLLCADDGSPTSLVRGPLRIPRSPYQRAARVAENPLRVV